MAKNKQKKSGGDPAAADDAIKTDTVTTPVANTVATPVANTVATPVATTVATTPVTTPAADANTATVNPVPDPTQKSGEQQPPTSGGRKYRRTRGNRRSVKRTRKTRRQSRRILPKFFVW